MSLLKHAPNFTVDQAETLAKDFYGLTAIASALPSERDQNFLVATESEKFVLKIANELEQRQLLEAQNDVLAHLAPQVSFTPHVIETKVGELITPVLTKSSSHLVRLVTFISGEPLAKVAQTPEVLFDLGRSLGKLRTALAEFDHAAFHRYFHWDLANGLRVVTEYDVLLADVELRNRIDDYASEFQRSDACRLEQLPRSVIHGDANDYNVIVDNERVVGLIDFGDMVYSYTVGDLAVALAYVVLDKSDPLSSAREVIKGYLFEVALTDTELELLWPLTLMRLCMSVCIAAFQQQQKPDNKYLDISQQSIRRSLPQLLSITSEKLSQSLKH